MSEFTVVGLRVVREAARCGSFSTAAEKLGYTQSAVSRQIALMEQAAGRALFERKARGVRPTVAGRVVVRHAETVLEELHAVRTDLRGIDAQPPARLRVGAFPTAMAALTPRALATLARHTPQTRTPLREGTSPSLLTAVARGRLDAAVVNPPTHPPDNITLTPLLDDPLLVATALTHPFAELISVTPTMLRTERWVAGSTDPRSTLLGAWSDSSWQPDIAYTARDWTAKLGLVAAGAGITIVPGLAVPALPTSIAVARIDHPSAARATALAHRRDDHDNPNLRTFAEALRDAAADLSAELRRALQLPHVARSR